MVSGEVVEKKRRPKGAGSISKLANGTYRLRIFVGTDPGTGRPRQITKTVSARNMTEAQRHLNKLRKDLDVAPQLGSQASVASLLEEWLRHSAARGRAPKTLEEARRTIDQVFVPAFGTVAVKDLDARHLDELYRRLLVGEGHRPLAPASVHRYHAVLSAALSQAVKWGWIDRNPAERASLPELGRQALVVPTTDEVRRLILAARAVNDRWGVILALAVGTGARRGELCGLRWTDVAGEAIRIRRSIYRTASESGEKVTKGGRERWVTVGPVVATLLSDWRQRCDDIARDAGVTLVPDAFVVSSRPDGSVPVNPGSLSSFVCRLCISLGMPHVHLHSLRHYAATELIGSGINPRDAAELLGHADPALTMRVYAHATADRQRQAADVLGRVLMPAESTP